MHGELAQAIALVTHGNWFLHDPSSRPAPELWGSNSTFRFVKVLRFMDASQFAFARDSKLLTPENRTAPWFEDLRERGAKRLLLYVVRGTSRSGLPEIVSVSFAGGSRWLIQADLRDRFELWAPKWDTPSLAEKGSWLVSYQRHDLERPVVVPPTSLDPFERGLLDAIRKNRDFASEALSRGRGAAAGLSFFIKMFEHSLSLVHSDDPKPSYPDMVPKSGYGLKSRQLLAVASNAWVFGGMSWWNDMWFDDPSLQSKHAKLIAELYDAVIGGLVAGANLFDE